MTANHSDRSGRKSGDAADRVRGLCRHPRRLIGRPPGTPGLERAAGADDIRAADALAGEDSCRDWSRHVATGRRCNLLDASNMLFDGRACYQIFFAELGFDPAGKEVLFCTISLDAARRPGVPVGNLIRLIREAESRHASVS